MFKCLKPGALTARVGSVDLFEPDCTRLGVVVAAMGCVIKSQKSQLLEGYEEC